MNIWAIKDEEGVEWEVTPILRMIKFRGDIIFQQKVAKIVRVKFAGAPRERETRWMDVPLLTEDYRKINEEIPH